MADDNTFSNLFAAGIGIGAGAYSFKSGIGKTASGSPVLGSNKNILLERLSTLKANSAIEGAVRGARIRTGVSFLDKVNDQIKSQNLSPDVVKKEWMNAMKSTVPDVSVFDIYPLGEDPVSTIRHNLRKNQSVYTFDVFSKFRYNLEALGRAGGGYNFTEASSLMGSNFGYLPSRIGQAPAGFEGLVDTMGGQGLYQFQRLGEEGQPGLWSVSRRRGGSLQKLFTVPQAFAAPGSDIRGLIRSGDNLQNLYAPGLFQQVDEAGRPTGSMLTFGEYKISRLQQAAEAVRSGSITGRTMEDVLRETSTEIDKMLPFVGASLGDEPLSPESVYRSMQFTAVDPQGQPLTGAAKRKFVEEFSESMGFVPTGGGSRFALASPEDLFGGFTSEIDYARKPWQRIRGYTPTDEAAAAITGSRYGGSEFDFLDSPLLSEQTMGGRPTAARLKTLYLDDSQIEYLRSKNIPIGDGELLVNKQMAQQLQVSRVRRLRVTEMDSNVAQTIMSRIGPNSNRGALSQAIALDKGAMLGRTLEGALETTKMQTDILGAAPVAVKTMSGETSTAVDLMLRETMDLSGSSKVFGGIKGQGRRLNFANISDQMLKQLNITRGELENVGAIGRASDLKKDPSKLLMQQFSGLTALARDATLHGDTGAAAQKSREFLASAGAELDRINQLEGGVEVKSAAIRALATDMGVGGKYEQMLFGSSGTRLGIATLAPGDPKELTGAGKIGTFEPRLITLMEGGAFGGQGENIANDMLTRLYYGRTDVKAMNEQLNKTLRSLTGDLVPGAADPVYDIGDLATTEIRKKFSAEGGFLATGAAEMPHIYVPGYNQAPAMRPRLVGSEQAIQGSPVTQVFKNIERDIELLAKGTDFGVEDFLGKFDRESGYVSELWQAYASGGKGQGAIARGKLLGSRFLTAVSDIGEAPSGFQRKVKRLEKAAPKGRVIGVPRSQAAKMFEEMASVYGEESIAGMRSRFESGEAIGGMVARHPFIGPYSAQPVLMVAADTPEPSMLVPETTRKLMVRGKEIEITEGVLTGLALDKDADIPMAIALNSEMEQKVRVGLTHAGSQLRQDLAVYDEHIMRSQLLKLGTKSSREMSAAQRAAAAVGKLGIVDEEVGRVSTSLTKARAALVNSNLAKADVTRGLSLLEWMEQQPISGKHLDPSQVLEGIFETQMARIRTGAGGHPEVLSSVVREMLDYSGDDIQKGINRDLLGKGLNIEGVGFIKGFELDRTSQQISGALETFMKKGATEQQEAIQKFLTPSPNQTVKRSQLARALAITSPQSTKGVRGFQQQALAAVNNAKAAAAAKVRPFAKPAMIGLAAAGTAAFLMSGSPAALPPPRFGKMDTSPPVRTTNQSRDEVQPPGSPAMGSPTSSPQMSNSTRMLDESDAQRRQSIRAKIMANNLSPQQRMALQNRLSSSYNGSISMNIRDSRRSLSNTTITDMLNQ